MRDEIKALIENEGINVIDRLIDELAIKRNRMIFEAFEKYGYTRLWIINNKKRISITDVFNGLNSEIFFCVDGALLFSIYTEYNTDKYVAQVGIKYYKALPEEKENEIL